MKRESSVRTENNVHFVHNDNQELGQVRQNKDGWFAAFLNRKNGRFNLEGRNVEIAGAYKDFGRAIEEVVRQY